MYKIEENNKIMDIVELILYSNDQNQDQQRNGLKILTPDQMLSRLPISFAQLNAGNNVEKLKGALSGLRQFLAIEIPSKMMKNAFYFTSRALSVLNIFKFLCCLFGHVAKQVGEKDKINVKFYDVTAWLTNNCNTHVAKYLEK